NNLKVTATIPVPAIADLTVTLSGISEFTGTQTITIPAGSTSAYTTLTANDDHAKAENKNVTIGISSVTGLSNVNFTLAEAINITVLDKDANCSNPAEPTVTVEAVCAGSMAAVITVTNHTDYTSPLYSLWTEASGGSKVGSDNNTGSITVSETFNEAKTYYLQVHETNAPAGCDISDRATVVVNIKEKPSDFSTNVTNATNGEQDGKIRFTAGIKGVKPFTIVLTGNSESINMTGYISGEHSDTTFTDLPPASDYKAVITGADGCGDVTISNITVTELACIPPADPVVSSGAQNICKGTGTTLTIGNYAAGVTYTLYNSANAGVATNSGSSTVTVPNYLPAGNYTLQGSGYNGTGECETSSQISVLTVKPVPSEAVAAVVQKSSPVTALGKISVTTGTLGGIPFTVILKKIGVDNDVVANNITVSHNFENLSAGSYSVVVTASNGCDTTIDNLTVVNCTPPAEPNVSDVSICPNTQANITINGYNDGIFKYELYNEADDAAIGSAVYANGVLTTPELSANTNYTVRATLKATALEGCKYSSKSVSVTINELPMVTLTPGPVTCADSGSIKVTVSGGQPYQDNRYDIRLNGSIDENKQISGYIYRDLDVATYTVKVIDKNGCFTTEQTTVSIDKTTPEITPEVTPSSAANNDGSIYVTLGNASQVSLNNGDPQTAPYTFQNLACGIYTLAATYDVTGCESTVQVKLSTSAPRMTLLPAWQVQGDSLTITFNTSSSSIQNTDLKFYNNDDLYVWGGVVFEDDKSKYVNSGVWVDIPENKFKMTKVTDYLYTYTIKNMSSLYELDGNNYPLQGWGLLKDVKGYKWLFRTAGNGSGNNILEEKNNSGDFYEDIHSFSVRVWATDVYERTNKDGYYQYYQGEKVKLLIEKYVDNTLNDGKKYPVEVKMGETSLLTLDKNLVYNDEAEGKLDTVLTLSAMLKDILRAYGYSEGGAVANSTDEYEHSIEVIAPVITLTQSTATANETDNRTNTISATIPVNYRQQIKIAVSVGGGTEDTDYTLSYDTIIIPVGQKSGYAVLTVLPDGLYTDRGNLVITSDGVVSGDVQFSVTGGPLTLTVENSEIPTPVITSLVPANDVDVKKNETVTIKVKANNTDTVYLYINDVPAKTTIADTLWYDYTPETANADKISVIAKNRYGLQTALTHIINVIECNCEERFRVKFTGNK
ncbi:MAG: hypothetical protein LBG17_03785, partial [Bacteroidales bacterium]|nr:hypothetical protein [Bacteroidales bacterium]